MDKVKFGRRLYHVRKERGITSEQLAEKLGTSGGYLRQLESGVRNPSVNMLIDICNELHTSPDYLLTGDLRSERETEFEEIGAKLRKLSEYQLRIIEKFIDVVADDGSEA